MARYALILIKRVRRACDLEGKVGLASLLTEAGGETRWRERSPRTGGGPIQDAFKIGIFGDESAFPAERAPSSIAPPADAHAWIQFFMSARSFFKDERQSI